MSEDEGGSTGRFTQTAGYKQLMRSVFELPVYASGLCVLDARNRDLGAFDTEIQAHAAARAINSHDDFAMERTALQLETGRLREALEHARCALEAMEGVANSHLDALCMELQQGRELDERWKREYATWVGVYNALAAIRALPENADRGA